MINLTGFDKNGVMTIRNCSIYDYDDLPMKGFGKDFTGVCINDLIIIPQSAILNDIVWEHTKNQIETRANDLKAAIVWREIPSGGIDKSTKYEMCFISKPFKKRT